MLSGALILRWLEMIEDMTCNDLCFLKTKKKSQKIDEEIHDQQCDC